MWLKSARLQYAYKVHVSDCKWVCSGQMNDVRCIRHFVTVVCLGEVGLSALQHKLSFSTHLFSQSWGPQKWDSEQRMGAWWECLLTMVPQKLQLHSCWRNKVYAIVKAEKTYFDFELKTEPQDITLQVSHNHLARLHFKLFSVRL